MEQRDRLSALPNELVHRILSFTADMRQPVQLSVLWHRWRHVWASMPYVSLYRSTFKSREASEKFGNLLLLLRECPEMHTLCLYSTHWEDFVDERRWIRHALNHKLRLLTIKFYSNTPFQVPDCVFNCATLEEIDLMCTYPSREHIAPKSVSLSRLKRLRLSFVQLCSGTMDLKNWLCQNA